LKLQVPYLLIVAQQELEQHVFYPKKSSPHVAAAE
jgi:hypothetical protein